MKGISRKPDAPRKKVRIGIFLQEMNSFSYAKEVYVESILITTRSLHGNCGVMWFSH